MNIFKPVIPWFVVLSPGVNKLGRFGGGGGGGIGVGKMATGNAVFSLIIGSCTLVSGLLGFLRPY